MTKITMTDTPTAQLIADAAKQIVVTDSKGRKITLSKPGVLAQYRIVEVMGDSAKNEVYASMVMPLIFVTDIAGDPIAQPKTKLQLEGLIQHLDDHGVDAVMKGVQENWGRTKPDEEKVALKK